MLSRFSPSVLSRGTRAFSTARTNNAAVAVMGVSAGKGEEGIAQTELNCQVTPGVPGIGQPLSLLLKLNPAVTKLNLYDIVHMPGVAADLSHVETKAKTTGFIGDDQIKDCLKDVDIIHSCRSSQKARYQHNDRFVMARSGAKSGSGDLNKSCSTTGKSNF